MKSQFRKRLDILHKKNDWLDIQCLKVDEAGNFHVFNKRMTRHQYEKTRPPFREDMGK